jgi:hypothetical protein
MEQPEQQPPDQMGQSPSELVYWDKHRIPVNLTLLFSLGVAAFGVFSYLQGADGLLLIFAGLGVAAYSWFTNPRQYRVYEDALVIIYGSPRTKVMLFRDLSHLEMRQLNIPDRLRVWPIRGRRVVIMARDPEAFHDQLQNALDEFRRRYPEFAPRQGEVEGDSEAAS